MRVSLVGVFYLRGGVAAFGLLGESGGETAHSAHITHSPLEMEILVIFSGGGRGDLFICVTVKNSSLMIYMNRNRKFFSYLAS